jgi:tripartite ATP-independent transporter DctM subunit
MGGFEWLALVMFGGFFLLILSGYPVGFSFAATGLVFGGVGLTVGAFDWNLVYLMPSRWFGTMSDFTLLAIPYFIFLGSVFEKSGLAEDLLETIGILLGPLRGGVALAVVIVGTILAATTGVVAATVIMMGLLSLPVMLRYGYNQELATGVITASGTLAQLIPPSLVLVVLSDQIGVSVGDLFLGALLPGILLALLYGLYVVGIAALKPEIAPALPPEVRILSGTALRSRIFRALLPPLILIILILGSIFFGLATPTEAGSVGAVGACILAKLNGRLTWKLVQESALSTAQITSLVIVIFFCSSFFSVVFDGLGGTRLITHWLTTLPGGFWMFLVVVNLLVFLLGIFLEFIEICFIAMPLVVPAAQQMGIDMVWLGVILAINLQTAFISPPIGFSLFYLQSVAPKEVSTKVIHRGALPFMGIQIVTLLIVICFPQTVRWLVDASVN